MPTIIGSTNFSTPLEYFNTFMVILYQIVERNKTKVFRGELNATFDVRVFGIAKCYSAEFSVFFLPFCLPRARMCMMIQMMMPLIKTIPIIRDSFV